MSETWFEAEFRRLQDKPLSELEFIEVIGEISDKLESALRSVDIQEAMTRFHTDSQLVENIEKALEVYTARLTEVDQRSSLIQRAASSWANNSQKNHIDDLSQLIDKARRALAKKDILLGLAKMRKGIQLRQKAVESLKPLCEELNAKIANTLNCAHSDEVIQLEIELAKSEMELERIRDYALTWINRFTGFQEQPYGDEFVSKERQLQFEEYKRLEHETTVLLELLKNSEYRTKLDPVFCELKVRETPTEEGLCELLGLYGRHADNPKTFSKGDTREYDRERARRIVALCKEALKKSFDS